MAGPSLHGIVNPALLKWAREAARISLADAAKKIGVTEQRLVDWEQEGAEVPTLSQLRRAANAYKRSVPFFFLSEKPSAAKAPTDFRRLELSVSSQMSPALSVAIRDAQEKRSAALDIFQQTDDSPPPFQLTARQGASQESVAADIANALGISMKDRATWQTDYEALHAWKSAVENLGVLVMQVSRVSLSEMRGCALALSPLPVILLNSSDSPLGRIFTMLHELTHLARREWSLCDISNEYERSADAQQVEVYCNQVAASILIPAGELLGIPAVAKASAESRWTLESLAELRRHFWASSESILRRLLTLGKTSQGYYQEVRRQFQEIYAKQGKAGGQVPVFRRVILGNGRYLTGVVIDAYDARIITGSELSRILGTKLEHLPKIVAEIRERAPA